MPCCHIPANPAAPVFPHSLISDAEIFSKYVGGMPLGLPPLGIGNPEPTTFLISALHLEMKLWEPTLFNWYINDAKRNSWGVMANRTTAPNVEFNRFTDDEKAGVFNGFTLESPHANCFLIPFDRWFLELTLHFRNQGLARVGIAHWDQNISDKPPELTTIGLVQKLINIFLKYETCWQVAGKWNGHALNPYAPPDLPHLPRYLCALHAPIDRILLNELSKTSVGAWLADNRLVRNGNLMQANGETRPWSKLDCLRTYYGFQLVLRKIAMRTWPKRCACDNSTDDAIRRCVNWFEEQFGKAHARPQSQTDWLDAAIKLPIIELNEGSQKQSFKTSIGNKKSRREMRDEEKRNMAEQSGKSTEEEYNRIISEMNTNIAPQSEPVQTICISNPQTKQDGIKIKPVLYLQEGPANYIKIVGVCNNANDGYICLLNHQDKKKHIWVKCGDAIAHLDIIAEIGAQGGNFMDMPGYVSIPADRNGPCCGGNAIPGIPNPYLGAREFESVDNAVSYLKVYFDVRACRGNRIYNQVRIDAC